VTIIKYIKFEYIILVA